ncbi:MAG TPA: hypothetical protein VJS44_14080 [Pyrinomonadaceae bacterium]|nr:hypothetical protein [Pyrinomonadaceae bacterium]
MKCTADEETMEKRRTERLKSVAFFMCDERVPESGRRVMSLHAAHNLLTGFFQNSHWRVVWFCIKRAVWNSWVEFSVKWRVRYYKRILKLSEEQIDERF